jgi:hypothetical protein
MSLQQTSLHSSGDAVIGRVLSQNAWDSSDEMIAMDIYAALDISLETTRGRCRPDSCHQIGEVSDVPLPVVRAELESTKGKTITKP